MKIFNRRDRKYLRKDLRSHASKSEQLLWLQIRNRQIEGLKFRRQHGVGRYVVDFYCPEIKLVIELDGDSHFTPEAIAYDRERTEYLEHNGLTVIRFTNTKIHQAINEVIITIIQYKHSYTGNPSLPPLGKGRRTRP